LSSSGSSHLHEDLLDGLAVGGLAGEREPDPEAHAVLLHRTQAAGKGGQGRLQPDLDKHAEPVQALDGGAVHL